MAELRSRSPSAAGGELRRALRRSRRQNATIRVLKRDKDRLGKRVRAGLVPPVGDLEEVRRGTVEIQKRGNAENFRQLA